MTEAAGSTPSPLALAVGDELRKARKARGWTRKYLLAEMLTNSARELSLQTLATYELGTRGLTLDRFAEVCAALELPMHELLKRAEDRIRDSARSSVLVDLDALANTQAPRLQPLRRWAAARSATTSAPTLLLDSAALTSTANFCDITVPELLDALRE
ncbi:MAG: helix-turn-helix domain-containing protein [Pseudonocardia sp.]